MAQENTNPDAVNPGTDPELPQPDTTVIPLSSIDTAPAEVNPETNSQVPQPESTPVVTVDAPAELTDEEIRAAQIADYRATYGEAVPLPTELSGLTENERQIQLWELKYPGVPAPTEYTGQSEEDRQRQLFELQYPGQPYPYDVQAPADVDADVDAELPQPETTSLVEDTSLVTRSPYIRIVGEDENTIPVSDVITDPNAVDPNVDPAIPVENTEENLFLTLSDTNIVEVQAEPVVENTEPFNVVLTDFDTNNADNAEGMLLVSPEDVPVTVQDDNGVLVEFTDNGERLVDADNPDFFVSDSELRISAEDIPVQVEQLEDGAIVEFTENGERIVDENGFVITEGGLRVAPEDIDEPTDTTDEGGLREPTDADVEEAVRAQAALDQARQQATVSAMRKANGTAVGDGDWRVRLRLAPNAYYLYKTDAPGIMEPLQSTDGVIFPYTPKIDIVYSANYNPTELVHSNYTGYFYKGSKVGEVVLNAQFTAQDSKEANYLLAVIHFFKSCTKMFYGQDNDRGAPPPLVFLSGLGEFQFNEHPCVISQFNYSLPDDVDYIRARGRQVSSAGITQGGNGLMWQRTLTSSTAPSYSLSSIWSRLTGANLPKGGQNVPPPPPNLGLNSPTYVPTKMNMTLTLLPMNTRSQVAQQFSLEKYANGNLLRGGFW